MPKPLVILRRSKLIEPVRDMLAALHGQGLCNYTISKKMAVDEMTIKRWLERLGLEPNRYVAASKRAANKLLERSKGEVDFCCHDIRSRCRAILGDRVKFDIRPGMHTLDGHLQTLPRIIDTANRIAPMLGKPHIGKKPNEIYKPRLVQNEVRV